MAGAREIFGVPGDDIFAQPSLDARILLQLGKIRWQMMLNCRVDPIRRR